MSVAAGTAVPGPSPAAHPQRVSAPPKPAFPADEAICSPPVGLGAGGPGFGPGRARGGGGGRRPPGGKNGPNVPGGASAGGRQIGAPYVPSPAAAASDFASAETTTTTASSSTTSAGTAAGTAAVAAAGAAGVAAGTAGGAAAVVASGETVRSVAAASPFAPRTGAAAPGDSAAGGGPFAAPGGEAGDPSAPGASAALRVPPAPPASGHSGSGAPSQSLNPPHSAASPGPVGSDFSSADTIFAAAAPGGGGAAEEGSSARTAAAGADVLPAGPSAYERRISPERFFPERVSASLGLGEERVRHFDERSRYDADRSRYGGGGGGVADEEGEALERFAFESGLCGETASYLASNGIPPHAAMLLLLEQRQRMLASRRALGEETSVTVAAASSAATTPRRRGGGPGPAFLRSAGLKANAWTTKVARRVSAKLEHPPFIYGMSIEFCTMFATYLMLFCLTTLASGSCVGAVMMVPGLMVAVANVFDHRPYLLLLSSAVTSVYLILACIAVRGHLSGFEPHTAIPLMMAILSFCFIPLGFLFSLTLMYLAYVNPFQRQEFGDVFWSPDQRFRQYALNYYASFTTFVAVMTLVNSCARSLGGVFFCSVALFGALVGRVACKAEAYLFASASLLVYLFVACAATHREIGGFEVYSHVPLLQYIFYSCFFPLTVAAVAATAYLLWARPFAQRADRNVFRLLARRLARNRGRAGSRALAALRRLAAVGAARPPPAPAAAQQWQVPPLLVAAAPAPPPLLAPPLRSPAPATLRVQREPPVELRVGDAGPS